MAVAAALLHLLVLVTAVYGGGLVRVNSGVEVSRGGSVFVTEAELQVGVEPSADCKVVVVQNEPVTQRVGRLSPQVFDCRFLPQEVRYVHNGNPLLDQDSVLLRVYRFTSSETQVDSVVLTVRVVDSGSGVAQLGSTPLVVPQFYGLSNAIDVSALDIKTPPNTLCTIRTLTSDINAPTVGRLVREESTPRKGRQVALCAGNKPCQRDVTEVGFLKTSCADFLSAGLKYQHLSPPSPQVDHVPIRVELRDQNSRTLLESQALWLPVLIHGAVHNQPPHAAFMASFILEVDQFILTPLSTAALDAEDHETPRKRLVFNVTVPPSEGYLTHLDDHTKAVTSFGWSDLHDMKVAYQPPNSSQSQRRNYELEVVAIDDAFTSSPPILVHLSIRASETNAPRVSWNMGLDLLEGQSRPITWEELQIVDNDNIAAVRLVAVDGPAHGRLSVRGGKAFMFGVSDLKEGVVVYHHSDSDSTRDHIVFRISDGRHTIRHKFPINVLPKDDSPPFLINNVAVEVQEGGAVRLQDYMLLASDLDSSDDHILYRTVSVPRAGLLVRKSSAHLAGTPVDQFLQRDLLQGHIFYQHSGQEVFEDSFDFTLSDSHEPPNLSQTYTVVVYVFPVKDQLPVEVSGSVRALTVKETEVVYVTPAHLHFRDPEHPDADLTYVITRPCFSPMHPGRMDAGRLFYTDGTTKKDHMMPVLKSFTQHAVNHMKVAFMPPVEDIGPEPLFVQFVFSVSDHQGGTVSDLLFNVTVTPVDDQAPEAFTNLLRVEEGGEAFVTEEHLLVRDPDSHEEVLTVQVQRTPRHGRLELQGRTLLQGDGFSLQDLRGLRLRYIHDDSETTEDEVGLKVTDGLNWVNVVLQIQILPMNDEPPQLGGGLRGALTCEEGGRVQVTVDYLSATDSDSDDSRLTYMLARSPGQGQLQRAGQSVDKFSQQDLLQGHVYYVHTGGEIGPSPVSDTVTLIISDGEAGGSDTCCHGDAMPPPVPLHGSLPVYDLNVTILPLNNRAPSITLGESMLVVDEGSWACLCGGVLGATDPDSPPDQLTFYLEAPPLHGFLENTLPPPGSEKSGAGVRVESFSFTHLNSGFINYVQSEHKGAEPRVDQLSVSVSDGLHRSAPVPVYIIIGPTNDEPPLLILNNFTVKEGGLRDLTPSILDASDLDAPPDLLTFTVWSPPVHGRIIINAGGAELLKGSPPTTSFTLQELRQGMKMVYLHDDTETLKDAVTLRLTDGVHTVEGTIQVTVEPVNDHEPRVLKSSGLEVDPGELRVISSMTLEAVDLDTPPEQVYYILNMVPRFGHLQMKVDSGWVQLVPGNNFTQDHVEMNRLWYQNHQAGSKGHDSFRFTLSDLDHQSPAQTFFISVRTVHKGELLLQSWPVQLSAGERVVLSTDVLLASDSAARPEKLVFTVLAPPRHGLVHAVRRPGVPLSRFTQLDVAAHQVCYTHDNSRHAQDDALSFLVTNGDSSLHGTLLFTVLHSDRVPPTLQVSAALHLQGGATAPITSAHLQLADPDTAAANLTYIVTRPPRHGSLLLRGTPLAAPLRFSQADVDRGDLVYRHAPGSPGGADSFAFLPSDSTNRGYLAFGQLKEEPAEFTIQVELQDRAPPSLTTRRSPSTVVQVGGARQGIFITNKHLQASDPDSPSDTLQYAISRPPRHGYLENAATGAYIRGRFTQQDLDQKAVLFVLPVDMDVTKDDFLFHLVDEAGNTAAPQTLDVSWSRVELSASCYRTCETAGTLQIQIQRSGWSLEPAYVSIQVEAGSAKPGRDFTHSSAGLIQFDPGVNLKLWRLLLVDDGLEENHENFTVTLKEPQNAILGPRSSASVEIIDPRGGRCDPDDLKVEEDKRPRAAPPPAPPAPPPAEKEEDPVIDIEAELLWENRSHPPRGDVPNRRPYQDLREGEEPQDQAPPSYGLGHAHQPAVPGAAPRVHDGLQVRLSEKPQEKVWTFHSLTSLRLEEMQPGDSDWSWSSHSHLLQEHRVKDSPQRDHPGTHQHKTGAWVSSRCPDGWTHHRRRCYSISSSVASWASADRTCNLRLNSSLSAVRSSRDASWLWRFVGRKSFWIGMSGGPGRWTWLDGRPVTFSRLQGGHSQEEEVGVACVLVENPKRWRSTNCSSQELHAFVCSAPTHTVLG